MFKLNYDKPKYKRIILTTALPYGNGPLHIGHAAEAIQACVFAKYRRFSGQDVIFLGADDAHGTAIEIAAEEAQCSNDIFVASIRTQHQKSYERLNVSYDAYHSTHSDENKALVEDTFARLLSGKHIRKQKINQLYDPIVGRTLEDRRVKGLCPVCKRPNQYGDSCECGETYDATALIEPVSTLSGQPPILVENEHLFITLDDFKKSIIDWLKSEPLQASMEKKTREWLNIGLKDWCITRTGPYFGFAVPNSDNLFFYVWMDAPIGYIAALQHYCDIYQVGRNAREVWNDTTTEIVHVIGKDIINFHALFWPCLLSAAGLSLPNRIHAHGFVSVGGEKMSKSRGNFVLVDDLVNKIESDAVRWVMATRLGASISDFDLQADAFVSRVNADLVGKIANIPQRLQPFLTRIGNRLQDKLPDKNRYQSILTQASGALLAYERMDLAEATRIIVTIADAINRLIETCKPWKIQGSNQLGLVLTQVMSEYRVVITLLQPICPILARRALAAFNETSVQWDQLEEPPLNVKLSSTANLFERLTVSQVSHLACHQGQGEEKESKRYETP